MHIFLTLFNFQDIPVNAIVWSVCCVLANLGICLLGLWRCFANNYLHWAATCTWLLLNLQGMYKMEHEPTAFMFFLFFCHQVLLAMVSVLPSVNILFGIFYSLSSCHMRCFHCLWSGAWLVAQSPQSLTSSLRPLPNFDEQKSKNLASIHRALSNKW